MPIIPLSETELNGWETTPSKATEENPYIWNVEIFTYTDGTKTVGIPHFLCTYRQIPIASVEHQYAPSDNTVTPPVNKWATTPPQHEDANPFFANIDEINEWLDSPWLWWSH